MPRVNIYIRKEDWNKWDAIANKPQWINAALNTSLIEMAINQDSWLLELLRQLSREDIDKFRAIENKPEWLHEHLNGPKSAPKLRVSGTIQAKDLNKYINRAILNDDQIEQVVGLGARVKQHSNLCEHFQPKGQCLIKGCKYGKGR